MTFLPKPERRGPKPRRPIPRRSGRPRKFNPFAASRKLEKLCDDTFALFIRVRGHNRCKLCGSRAETQCAHLISRRYHSCRHAADNAWCLCKSCHARWTNDPLGWDALMVETFGRAEWDRRCLVARVPCRPDYSVMRLPLKLLLLAEVRTEGTNGLGPQLERIMLRHEAYERKEPT